MDKPRRLTKPPPQWDSVGGQPRSRSSSSLQRAPSAPTLPRSSMQSKFRFGGGGVGAYGNDGGRSGAGGGHQRLASNPGIFTSSSSSSLDQTATTTPTSTHHQHRPFDARPHDRHSDGAGPNNVSTVPSSQRTSSDTPPPQQNHNHHHHHTSSTSTFSIFPQTNGNSAPKNTLPNPALRRFSDASTALAAPVSNYFDSFRSSGKPSRRAPPPPLQHTALKRMASTASTQQSANGPPSPQRTASGAMSPTKRISDENRPQLGLTRKRSGFSSFMSNVLGSPKRVPVEISKPINPIHLTHVGFDFETGQFTVCAQHALVAI